MINNLSLQGITTRMADFLLQRQNIDDTCRATRKRGGYPAPILTTYAICADSGVAWRARTRAGATPDRNHHYQFHLSSYQLASSREWCGVVDARNSHCICFPGLFSIISCGHSCVARALSYPAYGWRRRGREHDNTCIVSHRPYGSSLVRCLPMGHTG